MHLLIGVASIAVRKFTLVSSFFSFSYCLRQLCWAEVIPPVAVKFLLWVESKRIIKNCCNQKGRLLPCFSTWLRRLLSKETFCFGLEIGTAIHEAAT
ncbi:hypothetical protein O6P43_006115 [Quillaja saponaria]|uniref:Uncharacterized protein n=1 Tax=Quillaja saponaria TaxID=32244 RepID=A0AAD7Q7M6_QUISA|nr:hypothetical protein O6P43_006115 [Quillaja saponaria]